MPAMSSGEREAALEDARQRDAFFTPRTIAMECWKYLQRWEGYDPALEFIEPSAGAGVFIEAAPPGVKIRGYDTEPLAAGIEQADFTALPQSRLPSRWGAIGNPPWGRHGRGAMEFVNHCIWRGAEFAAFLCPAVSAYSFYGQIALTAGVGLAAPPLRISRQCKYEMPKGGFRKVGEAAFCIWVRGGERERRKPPRHEDFDLPEWKACDGAEFPLDCDFAFNKNRAGVFWLNGEPPPDSGIWAGVIDRTGSPAKLLQRFRKLPWAQMDEAAQDRGNNRGTIPRYAVVEAYAAIHGGGECGQQALFAEGGQ